MTKRRTSSEVAIGLLEKQIAKLTHTEKFLIKESNKNPDAVSLGRLGGRKGGKARAEKLSAERRKEIAVNASKARWANESKAMKE